MLTEVVAKEELNSRDSALGGKTTKCTPIYCLDYHMTGTLDIMREVFYCNVLA